MILLHFIHLVCKKIAKLLGYNLIITKINQGNKDKGYESINPIANYAPWLLDNSFQKTFETIKKHTLVDKYRCYELWQLVAETAKLKGALIEVGVWRGGTGVLIAKSAELNGIKDTVYLCDTFSGVVKAGIEDSYYKDGKHSDTSKEAVEELIQKLKLKNTKILKGIFPNQTANLLNEDKFRFCHIDVDVYRSAKDIIEWIWPKMSKGGLIVYDDYGFQSCDGITKFVNEERMKNDRLIIYNLNGHAIVIKLE